MILAIDVQYDGDTALAGGVLFESWTQEKADKTVLKSLAGIEPYEPGSFYKRELPCLLALVEEVRDRIDTIVVDGFVTLGKEHNKGLGKHLYQALNGEIVVIGVAKRPFKETPPNCELHRGLGEKPLYVTAAGIGLEEAKAHIASMHGKFRNPTLLKLADQLCRGIVSQGRDF
ncbi:MAG: endonuclease V [Spirochaetales bacterium]|nr:endonuclease V [Spirochaetales bacterium]